jgi:hypothetical protein
MSHFAKVENGIVTNVIVAEQDFIDSGAVGDPATWIQTSYNTFGGVHKTGGTPLRKNYAGLGYTYDSERDAFIPPKLYPSWVLNESTCWWEAPTPAPESIPPTETTEGTIYVWDEETVNWVARTIPATGTPT